MASRALWQSSSAVIYHTHKAMAPDAHFIPHMCQVVTLLGWIMHPDPSNNISLNYWVCLCISTGFSLISALPSVFTLDRACMWIFIARSQTRCFPMFHVLLNKARHPLLPALYLPSNSTWMKSPSNGHFHFKNGTIAVVSDVSSSVFFFQTQTEAVLIFILFFIKFVFKSCPLPCPWLIKYLDAADCNCNWYPVKSTCKKLHKLLCTQEKLQALVSCWSKHLRNR